MLFKGKINGRTRAYVRFSYNSRVCVLKNLDELNISGSLLYRIVPAEKTNGQSKDRSAERKSLGGHGN